MEFEHMDGNLFHLMKHRRSPFPEDRIKSVMYQLFSAISYIHTNGYFHRDLKPENILYLKQGEIVKLADFGLTREIRSVPPFTEYVSTRWYRAPELLMHNDKYNSPVDLWAVGCIMAELFLLRPLFPGDSESETLNRIEQVVARTYKPDKSNLGLGRSVVSLPQKTRNLTLMSLSSLIPNASKDAIDLMERLLIWEPNDRLKASAALRHKFFDDLQNINGNIIAINSNSQGTSLNSNSLLGAGGSTASNSQLPSIGGGTSVVAGSTLHNNHTQHFDEIDLELPSTAELYRAPAVGNDRSLVTGVSRKSLNVLGNNTTTANLYINNTHHQQEPLNSNIVITGGGISGADSFGGTDTEEIFNDLKIKASNNNVHIQSSTPKVDRRLSSDSLHQYNAANQSMAGDGNINNTNHAISANFADSGAQSVSSSAQSSSRKNHLTLNNNPNYNSDFNSGQNYNLSLSTAPNSISLQQQQQLQQRKLQSSTSYPTMSVNNNGTSGNATSNISLHNNYARVITNNNNNNNVNGENPPIATSRVGRRSSDVLSSGSSSTSSLFSIHNNSKRNNSIGVTTTTSNTNNNIVNDITRKDRSNQISAVPTPLGAAVGSSKFKSERTARGLDDLMDFMDQLLIDEGAAGGSSAPPTNTGSVSSNSYGLCNGGGGGAASINSTPTGLPASPFGTSSFMHAAASSSTVGIQNGSRSSAALLMAGEGRARQSNGNGTTVNSNGASNNNNNSNNVVGGGGGRFARMGSSMLHQ